MSHDYDDRKETIRTVASALSLQIDDRVDEILDDLTTLEAITDTFPHEPEPSHPHDEVVNDEYNAFLAGYSTPRQSGDGPLSDLVIAVKDNVEVDGLPMTCGSREFECWPAVDALLVERLLDAGAAIKGKTNMDAFAFGPSGEFSDFGQVQNPTAPTRVPGGSSSGSAVAVAAGLVDGAIGTDTGGSVRMPPACCGVVGIKPTSSMVPTHGVVPMAPSLDAVGTIARDVKTAVRILKTIAGPDPCVSMATHQSTTSIVDSLTAWDGFTVGLPNTFLEPVTPPIHDAIQSLAATLDAREDVSVEPIDLPGDVDHERLDDCYSLISMIEFAGVLRQCGVVRGLDDSVSDACRGAFERMLEAGLENERIRERVLPAAVLDAEEFGQPYVAAQRERKRFRALLEETFTNVDLLLVPTLRQLPPQFGESNSPKNVRQMNGNNVPFNLADVPAVAVPVASDEGIPVSVQVVAPKFEDIRAVQMAQLIERMVDRTGCD
ncbi:amidase [Natrinema gelatinilyticum]|uniref:amidase n=1 Tax=Natrinema gelatinilyticum TaxID=2961571 RepID=UPI0020C27C3C|nr:amidase [Natrinema gelatinilyticum]